MTDETAPRTAAPEMAAPGTPGPATIDFWDWLEEERERRHLSRRAIEIMANGKPNGRLGRRLRRGQPPTPDLCRDIALAFGLPLETVLRRANLMAAVEGDAQLQDVVATLAQLTPVNLLHVSAIATALLHDQPDARPILPARPYSMEDFDRFLRELTYEERASLADALGLGHAAAG